MVKASQMKAAKGKGKAIAAATPVARAEEPKEVIEQEAIAEAMSGSEDDEDSDEDDGSEDGDESDASELNEEAMGKLMELLGDVDPAELGLEEDDEDAEDGKDDEEEDQDFSEDGEELSADEEEDITDEDAEMDDQEEAAQVAKSQKVSKQAEQRKQDVRLFPNLFLSKIFPD